MRGARKGSEGKRKEKRRTQVENGVTKGRRELQGWQTWKAAVDLRKNWGIGKF